MIHCFLIRTEVHVALANAEVDAFESGPSPNLKHSNDIYQIESHFKHNHHYFCYSVLMPLIRGLKCKKVRIHQYLDWGFH